MKTWELVLALVITAPFGQSCIDAANRQRMTVAEGSPLLEQVREQFDAQQGEGEK